MEKVNLVGQLFGHLTVTGEVKRSRCGQLYWLCKCDCGKEVIVRAACLRNNITHSCGCSEHTVYGMTSTRLYDMWTNIKQRCNNSNATGYSHYGGRGIKICSEWKESFQVFYDFATTHGYKKELTIERIDNDGDYCPENVCFIPLKAQAQNRRSRRSHGETTS